ncbi:hypothetical protein [Ruminococcus flavefaciens]|uniref:Uncharacterized protein n=1 Tax=Ruminococcus flavefaciens TaxID=1265 RepID=A0A1M7MDU4_RUMFL|nr:hypothetical protein [Ruminococcus flavefaciens]SHM88509.1 hypothetical protein SAMN04487860_12121 [Ruminococcus flavefaciens]
MNEKRFSILLILLAVVSFGIGFFGFAVESIIFAVGVIIVSMKLREKYLIKIPTAICIVSIIFSAAFLAFMIYTGIKGTYNDYWLMKLIFGAHK